MESWQSTADLETRATNPKGAESYRLAVIPLWAVEGGIVGMEFLVADPKRPNDNLLGERQTDVPQPFVITIEELEAGIDKSLFGATRLFNVGHSELRIEVKGSRLGKGVGECRECSNIQEMTLQMAFRSR